jgi:hypothetical protein
MSQFEPDEILGMPGVQHLFDAYVVGLFARIWNDHHACSVRLVQDSFPDAELRDQSGVLKIEATMADQKDRRMAQEHRLWRERRERGEMAALPIDRELDREYALEAVPRVCQQKVRKYLGSASATGRVEVALLIYVNFSNLAGPVLTDEDMSALTERWQDNFEAIWFLSAARIYRAWPSALAMHAISDPLV